jgi:hypothetical protein
MGLTHTIRAKNGAIKKVTLTPIKAIRYQCLECNGWENPVKDDCLGRYCPLYPYRNGENPVKTGIGVVKNLPK